MQLTREDYQEINRLEARIGAIFSNAKMVWHGVFKYPECCLAGRPGYDEILKLRRQIRRIRNGKDVHEA